MYQIYICKRDNFSNFYGFHSEKGSTPKEKSLLPLGANSFLLEFTPFLKGLGVWCGWKQTWSPKSCFLCRQWRKIYQVYQVLLIYICVCVCSTICHHFVSRQQRLWSDSADLALYYLHMPWGHIFRPRGYKTFFSCSTQLSMKFHLVIKIKIPTIITFFHSQLSWACLAELSMK